MVRDGIHETEEKKGTVQLTFSLYKPEYSSKILHSLQTASGHPKVVKHTVLMQSPSLRGVWRKLARQEGEETRCYIADLSTSEILINFQIKYYMCYYPIFL